MSTEHLKVVDTAGTPEESKLNCSITSGIDLQMIAHPYKGALPVNFVIDMALVFLPKDGTDWVPRLHKAHKELSKSFLFGDAADVPAKVAEYAFESMGYQYFEIENGAWRRRLGRIAYKHWMMLREAAPRD